MNFKNSTNLRDDCLNGLMNESKAKPSLIQNQSLYFIAQFMMGILFTMSFVFFK